jgi:hypothetical protein
MRRYRARLARRDAKTKRQPGLYLLAGIFSVATASLQLWAGLAYGQGVEFFAATVFYLCSPIYFWRAWHDYRRPEPIIEPVPPKHGKSDEFLSTVEPGAVFKGKDGKRYVRFGRKTSG